MCEIGFGVFKVAKERTGWSGEPAAEYAVGAGRVCVGGEALVAKSQRFGLQGVASPEEEDAELLGQRGCEVKKGSSEGKQEGFPGGRGRKGTNVRPS